MDRSILESVHEGAQDLHKTGVMDEVTLHEFDALCQSSIKELKHSRSESIESD